MLTVVIKLCYSLEVGDATRRPSDQSKLITIDDRFAEMELYDMYYTTSTPLRVTHVYLSSASSCYTCYRKLAKLLIRGCVNKLVLILSN